MNRGFFTPLILLIISSMIVVSSGFLNSECSKVARKHGNPLDRFIGRLNCSLYKVDNAKRNLHASIVDFKQKLANTRTTRKSRYYLQNKTTRSPVKLSPSTTTEPKDDLDYPIDIRMSQRFTDYDEKLNRVVREVEGNLK